MKVGVFTVILRSMPFEQALDYLAGLGVQTVEIGAGAFSGTAHCEPEALLASDRALRAFRQAMQSRGLEISCLSVHGNPLHPNREIAEQHHAAFDRCLRLANRLEVEVVTTFSGCPGGAAGDQRPNWVTCPWPTDFAEILDYQWNQVAIPYWQETVQLASRHGIKKIALEMHPGFVVYNPESMLKLRSIAGKNVGCNFDPSHLFWQNIDPLLAVRVLADCIFHVHAKDRQIYPSNLARTGVLDT